MAPVDSIDDVNAQLGANAWLVDEMYHDYLTDPGAISESWREFFVDYKPGPAPSAAPEVAVAPTTTATTPASNGATAPSTASGVEGLPEGSEPLRGVAARIVAQRALRCRRPQVSAICRPGCWR